MFKSINQDTNHLLLSIIIPFKDTKIDQFSALMNSLKLVENDNVEFIFINDHSMDVNKYEEIIKGLHNSFLLDNDKDGVSSARNKGINASQGKYITFMDSDDLFDINVLKWLLNSNPSKDYYIFEEKAFVDGKNPQYSGLISHIDMIDINEDDLKELFVWYRVKNTFDACLALRSVYGKIYKKETIKTLFNEDLRFYEDSLFVAQYYNSLKNISAALIKIPLYFYRIDFSSASRKFNTDYNDYYQRYFDAYYNYFCYEDNDYLFPLAFDSISIVLPVKVTQAFKHFRHFYTMKIIKSYWAKDSVRILTDFFNYLDPVDIKIVKLINGKKYFLCFAFIIYFRIIKSASIRFRKIFQHE